MADSKDSKSKVLTKSAVFQEIAKTTNLSRKQVSDVFEALSTLIKSQLGKKGPGVFTLPGLFKMKRVVKPATKAAERILVKRHTFRLVFNAILLDANLASHQLLREQRLTQTYHGRIFIA